MRLPRWKKEQKEKKKCQLKAKARFLLLAVISAGIILIGFSLLKIYTASVLPQNGRVTVIFNTSPILVLSYDQTGEVTFLKIPSNLYLESIHGYGQYKLDSLYALGKLEKKGGELLAGSIQEFLGVPVDGWVELEAEVGNGRWEVGSAGIEKFPIELIRAKESNLSAFDLLKIWWKIKGTKANLIQVINLQDAGVFTKYFLPDNSEGLTADQAKLDGQLAEIFKDSGVVSEHLMVEVLNASEKPEMANRATRLITNLGGTVISLGNSPEESDHCQLRTEAKVLKSLTAQRLKKIFNCQEILLKSGESRADLQLIIGLDYWQKLHLQL